MSSSDELGVLPNTLDFQPKRAAARANIQRASLPPTNNSVFAPRSQCVFRIPTGTFGSYLDLSGSYLKFTVTNTVGTAVAAAVDGLATSFIQRLEASVAGGTPLFVIEEVGCLTSVLIDHTVSRGDRVTKWGMAGAVDLDNPLAAGAYAQNTSYLNYRRGVSIAQNGSVTLCTPLPGPLGLHGESRLFPIGSVSTPIEIRITWADSAYPLTYAGAATPSWSISNASYEACIVNLDSQVHRSLDMQLGGVYNMNSSSFLHSSSIVQAGDTSFNIQLNGSVASAQMVIVCVRDNSTLTTATVNSVTGRVTGGLTNVQLRIGTAVYPSVPINIDAFGAEARAELLKAFACMTRGDVGSCVTQDCYNDATGSVGGFALAFNLDSFRCTDALLDGVSCELQSLQLIGNRTSTANAMRVDAWVMHDILHRVEGGMLQRYENSAGLF